MAIGTITAEASVGAGGGPVFHNLISFAGDGAYPTGGTAGFQTSVRDRFGDNREVLAVMAQHCGAYGCVYDKANDKLFVYVLATGVEVANTTNLAATEFNVLVLSK